MLTDPERDLLVADLGEWATLAYGSDDAVSGTDVEIALDAGWRAGRARRAAEVDSLARQVAALREEVEEGRANLTEARGYAVHWRHELAIARGEIVEDARAMGAAVEGS